MKLIFKSMVSLLVLANLAVAAGDDKEAAASKRPVFALPAPTATFEEQCRGLVLAQSQLEENAARLAADQAFTAYRARSEFDDRLAAARRRVARTEALLEAVTEATHQFKLGLFNIPGLVDFTEVNMHTSPEQFLKVLSRHVQGEGSPYARDVEGQMTEAARRFHTAETQPTLSEKMDNTKDNLMDAREVLEGLIKEMAKFL
jgi:hypothetical protein